MWFPISNSNHNKIKLKRNNRMIYPTTCLLVDTNINISEQGSSTMPNVSKKEEQSKRGMTKSKPTPWTATKNAIRFQSSTI
ncbi:hypothetical protein Lal_00024312 [Lupinus albus]|nr:hypothetical protein Lal_00024312 [Lupinus albus]